MSKISLEFDTETKKLTVSVNGEELSGVESCYIYRTCDYCCSPSEDEDEKHYVEIGVKEDSGDDTMKVYKRICAADKNINIKANEEKLIADISKMITAKYKG